MGALVVAYSRHLSVIVFLVHCSARHEFIPMHGPPVASESANVVVVGKGAPALGQISPGGHAVNLVPKPEGVAERG